MDSFQQAGFYKLDGSWDNLSAVKVMPTSLKAEQISTETNFERFVDFEKQVLPAQLQDVLLLGVIAFYWTRILASRIEKANTKHMQQGIALEKIDVCEAKLHSEPGNTNSTFLLRHLAMNADQVGEIFDRPGLVETYLEQAKKATNNLPIVPLDPEKHATMREAIFNSVSAAAALRICSGSVTKKEIYFGFLTIDNSDNHFKHITSKSRVLLIKESDLDKFADQEFVQKLCLEQEDDAERLKYVHAIAKSHKEGKLLKSQQPTLVVMFPEPSDCEVVTARLLNPLKVAKAAAIAAN